MGGKPKQPLVSSPGGNESTKGLQIMRDRLNSGIAILKMHIDKKTTTPVMRLKLHALLDIAQTIKHELMLADKVTDDIVGMFLTWQKITQNALRSIGLDKTRLEQLALLSGSGFIKPLDIVGDEEELEGGMIFDEINHVISIIKALKHKTKTSGLSKEQVGGFIPLIALADVALTGMRKLKDRVK